MFLDPIEREHMQMASDVLDAEGRTTDNKSIYKVHIVEKNRSYPFKTIVREAFFLATGRRLGDEFGSDTFTRGHISRRTGYAIINTRIEREPFFTEDDILFFADYAGQVYNAEDVADTAAGSRLSDTIFRRTSAWAMALDLPGFQVKVDNSWQRRGYYSGYSWARIFRSGDDDRQVFFTVGVDVDRSALVYKLDCKYDGPNALTVEQQRIFYRMVEDTPAIWQQVNAADLIRYSWERLIEETRLFITHYAELYDEVVEAVWNSPERDTPSPGDLKLHSVIVGPGDLLPRRRLTSGRSRDYDLENKACKQIGDGGEALVKAYEQRLLRKAGRDDLAALVAKQPDWVGFDILSFTTEGHPKHIEVKTTTGSREREFYLSWHEKVAMDELTAEGTYFLYRLFNYDRKLQSAEFDIIPSEMVRELSFEAHAYRSAITVK